MVKRKREATTLQNGAPNSKTRKIAPIKSTPVYISIIAGSYEKVLHGIIAGMPREVLHPEDSEVRITPKSPSGKENVAAKDAPSVATEEEKSLEDKPEITFADTFMFTAHTSAIRCLTLSPIPSPDDTAQKVLLASGANDERINLYNLSTTPPEDLLPQKGPQKKIALPSLSGVKVSQNVLNKELGSLDHHNGAITGLLFPTRGKLITAAEDNTISISRTRDWTVLSTIKAPVPKALGRPSGDTAAPGEVPAGVNDFAVHPSMKIMLSVGKGEKSMRLWNLVTGKKAGVLSFEKNVLQAVGEGRYGTGEGRRIAWDGSEEPTKFVVGFERGAVVYSIDCEVQGVVVPKPASKLHQMRYVPGVEGNVLAVSTEDGRILFFDTEIISEDVEDEADAKGTNGRRKESIPECKLIAQLGGRQLGVTSRIKDFTILSANPNTTTEDDAPQASRNLIFVTGSSDGTIRLWSLSTGELDIAREAASTSSSTEKKITPQVGHLLSQYESGNRITCLTAFIMNERTADLAEGEESEFGGFSEAAESGSDESDSESD